MDKPIYCFKVNPCNGEITKYAITDYRKRKINDCGRMVYTFKNPKVCDGYAHYSIENSKLDRFVNYKVFTFDGNQNHAEKIITNTICDKYIKAQVEMRKIERLMEILHITQEVTMEETNNV